MPAAARGEAAARGAGSSAGHLPAERAAGAAGRGPARPGPAGAPVRFLLPVPRVTHDRVFEIRLVSLPATERAFRLLSGAGRVASVSVEPHARRIRFLAPEGVARALVERIYLDGDLAFCTGHRLARRG